jgi:hypothetical protein
MDRTLVTALEERDDSAAQRFIEDEPDPARVLAMYHGAIRHLYWNAKDIHTLVRIGCAAIAYGTTNDQAEALKPIAYDIGSFCWPGWDEPGITIDGDVLAFGAEAAALNLALAVQLNRPPLAHSMAHWLVGAHELAAGRRAEAAASFERSRAIAVDAGDSASELLAVAYAAIARGEPWDEVPFEGVDDGAELVAQLRTAQHVFARTP